MDPGRASAAEEAPGREEELKQKHIQTVQTTGVGVKKRKQKDLVLNTERQQGCERLNSYN